MLQLKRGYSSRQERAREGTARERLQLERGYNSREATVHSSRVEIAREGQLERCYSSREERAREAIARERLATTQERLQLNRGESKRGYSSREATA